MSKIKTNVSRGVVLAIIVLMGMVVEAVALAGLQINSRRIEDSLTKNVIEAQSQLNDLRTCYDNNVHPCNDEATKAYNKANGLYPQ